VCKVQNRAHLEEVDWKKVVLASKGVDLDPDLLLLVLGKKTIVDQGGWSFGEKKQGARKGPRGGDHQRVFLGGERRNLKTGELGEGP